MPGQSFVVVGRARGQTQFQLCGACWKAVIKATINFALMNRSALGPSSSRGS